MLRASNVRSQFLSMGIDGSGVKVGVISNGAASRATSIASGDLPSGLVVNSANDGDEGTAMLEIVHDLAPGASLYFAGAHTVAEMQSAIAWMQSSGIEVDIIVDDLGFFGQPYFTDGVLASDVAAAVSNGVTYITAAGNHAQQHYQTQFSTGSSYTVGTTSGNVHRDSSGDEIFRVTLPARSVGQPTNTITTVSLQWSDPWGASGNDYKFLYSFDGSSFSALTGVVQTGSQDPADAIAFQNPNFSSVDVYIAIWKPATAPARELELFAFEQDSKPVGLERIVTSDSVFGHQAVLSVISVGAVDSITPTAIESYSSRGDSTIYTNFSTQTKTARVSLDGVSTDGVATTVPGFTDFHGTSAAAPHLAAIAALMLDANLSLTPAQVSSILATTAVDILTSGYDNVSGAGRFDALSAVYKAFTPAMPDLDAGSDLGFSPIDNVTKVSTPLITGTVPANSYVRLYDGVNQIGTQQLMGGDTTFEITPAAALSNGGHSITVRVAESSSTPLANLSNSSSILAITIDTVAPGAPGNLDLTGTDSGPFSNDNITNDKTPTFAWTAASAGGGTAIARYWLAIDDNTPFGSTSWTSLEITLSEHPDAVHTFYIIAEDAAGNISTTTSLDFTIDTIAPKVSQVFVDSSAWTSGFYTRLQSSTLGTSDGFEIPDGADQLKTIWFVNADRVVVQFNEPVDVQQTDLSLSGGPSINGLTYNSATNTARWTLSTSMGNANLTMTLDGNQSSAVQDIAGNKLDGEWTNASSAYPSGNGTAGGNFVFDFNVLPADVDQNGVVDIFDVNLVSLN